MYQASHEKKRTISDATINDVSDAHEHAFSMSYHVHFQYDYSKSEWTNAT